MSKINTNSNCSWPALLWGRVFSCQMKCLRSWENIVSNKFRFLKWQSGSGLQGEESRGELYLKIHISCPVMDWFFCLFVLLYTALWICLRINYNKYLFSKKFYWDVIHTLYNSPFSIQPSGFWYITIFLKIVVMKPFTLDADLNPCAGTWTLVAGTRTYVLLTEIVDLVLGPDEAQILDVSSQKEFSERQNDRLEVDLFREKQAPQTDCGPSERVSGASKCGMVSFYGLGNFIVTLLI